MAADDHWKAVPEAKRIVVKIGTSTLTREGQIRPDKFTSIVRDVEALLDDGRQVIIVSSGAIAIGSHRLGWNKQAQTDRQKGQSLREKQAAAAVGQIGLLELYQRRFARSGRQVGQILLTRSGLEDRERFLNARRTMLELLDQGVVPIVNENDTVVTEEIRFGDNDNLAATLASVVEADLLVILTDVEGLYESPPEQGKPRPKLIRTVEKITPEIEALASGAASRFSSGGMITKIQAAQNAAGLGAATILCHGRTSGVLQKLMAGKRIGTLFAPGDRLAGRKHWLTFTAKSHGQITIDAGAEQALTSRGGSLLPAGVLAVEGHFEVGDSVVCVNQKGHPVARGLSSYSSEEARQLAGQPTKEINRVLGYSNGDEIIHRDDLALVSDDTP